MDFELQGRRALVCGGTSGLGKAVATALSHEGAHVTVAGRRGELAEQIASSLSHANGTEMDLTEPTSIEAACTVADAGTGIDILILNGGGPSPSDAATVSVEDIRKGAELLFYPMQHLLQLTLPTMRQAGWGRVVAIGSSGVVAPIQGLSVSNAMRAALWGHLKTLAGEIAGDGVTVNMAVPGRINTDRVQSLDAKQAQRSNSSLEAVRAASQSRIPAGRYGTPEEFAAAVAFLCSEPASFITGTQLRVDGGMVAAR